MKKIWGFDCEFGRIQLLQHGKDQFSVVYGLQHDRNLDYGQAAAKLGRAIMHWQARLGNLHDAGMMDLAKRWAEQDANGERHDIRKQEEEEK